MEASAACVYLWFNDVTDEQRNAVVEQLNASLSPDMTLSEQYGRPCVRVETRSDEAAVIAVQRRLKPILSKLGLADDQVTWGLDPHLS